MSESFKIINLKNHDFETEDFISVVEEVVPFDVNQTSFFKEDDDFVVKSKHLYIKSHKAFFCIKGEIELLVGADEEKVVLSALSDCLYVPPKTWLHISKKSADSVFIVLSSHEFSQNDFIKEKPWDS